MWKLSITLLYFVLTCNGMPVEKGAVGRKENPGKSCKDIQDRGGTSTGNYYIKVGGQLLLVYCNQDLEGGGWTLVYSYTFTNFNHFDTFSNAISPRPSWNPMVGDTLISTIPPLSETDYNAVDFNLWKEIGREFLVKSNVNNWISCVDGSGSLVNFVEGSVKCKLVKNYTGMCPNVVPNHFKILFPGEKAGPLLDISGEKTQYTAYYGFSSSTDSSWPTHDPCGKDAAFVYLHPTNPHGNIYLR